MALGVQARARTVGAAGPAEEERGNAAALVEGDARGAAADAVVLAVEVRVVRAATGGDVVVRTVDERVATVVAGGGEKAVVRGVNATCWRRFAESAVAAAAARALSALAPARRLLPA